MALIGILVSFFAIVVAVYVAAFTVRTKAICFDVRSYGLAAPHYAEGVGVTLDGFAIQKLQIHNLFLWNSGNVEIESSDILEKLRFTIFPETSRLKLVDWLSTQPDALVPSVKGSDVVIKVRTLNPGEGMWLQVVEGVQRGEHIDQKPAFTFVGNVRGLTRRIEKREARPLIDLYFTFKYSFIFEMLFFIGMAIFIIFSKNMENNDDVWIYLTTILIILNISVLLPFWRTPLLRVPREFLPYWDQYRWLPK